MSGAISLEKVSQCIDSDRELSAVVKKLAKEFQSEFVAKLISSIGIICVLSRSLGVDPSTVLEYITTFAMQELSFHEELASIPKVVEYLKQRYGVAKCSNVVRLPWSHVVDYMLRCTDANNNDVRIYVEVAKDVKSKNIDKIVSILKTKLSQMDDASSVGRVLLVLFDSINGRITDVREIDIVKDESVKKVSVHDLFRNLIEYWKRVCREKGFNAIEIDGVLFCLEGTILDSVVLMCGDAPAFSGIRAIVNPNNRSFFLKTRHLLRCGVIDTFVKLFNMLGYRVTREDVERRYREAEEYTKKQQEKWERIKRAWGLPDRF